MRMIIIPAIDLLNGGCVRLRQGDYKQAVRYNDAGPVARARRFEAAGIRRIHIVDLDAAKGEGRHNRDVIRRIRRAVSCVLETGGGIRREADVEELLDAGVDRLILGTLLARDPGTVRKWISRYGRKFIAGIDARDGLVQISGWTEGSALSDIALAKMAADMGALSAVYTNIARDGMLGGPDIKRTLAVARAAGIPVILSGGISSADDIREAAAQPAELIPAIITGKAVYEGKIDLAGLAREYPQDAAQEAAW
jgi:phosphoribosylformimino-5-aminoimidazole carboxamide ribotide isomerase